MNNIDNHICVQNGKNGFKLFKYTGNITKSIIEIEMLEVIAFAFASSLWAIQKVRNVV